MPRRYGGGYGRSYYGGGETSADPLAAAIASTFEGFQEARARAEDKADRKREIERQEVLDRERLEDRTRNEEDRQWNRRRDESSRRFQLAQEGMVERETPRTAGIPGVMPSYQIPGQSTLKVMPSQRERASDLEATIKGRLEQDEQRKREENERAALIPAARRLGIQGGETMSLPELRDAVKAAEGTAKTAGEKELITFREREQSRFATPKAADIPSENAKAAFVDKITSALGFAPFVEREAQLTPTDQAEAKRLGITLTDWKAAHARLKVQQNKPVSTANQTRALIAAEMQRTSGAAPSVAPTPRIAAATPPPNALPADTRPDSINERRRAWDRAYAWAQANAPERIAELGVRP